MNKILIVGSGMEGSIENIYFRAFKKLEYLAVSFFDTSKQKNLYGETRPIVRAINRFFIPLYYRYVCDQFRNFLFQQQGVFDAIIIIKGAEFPRKFLESCRLAQPSALWININPDDPFNAASPGSSNSNIIDSLSFYDIYFIWAQRLVGRIKQQGAQLVEYLPFGYDPDFHVPPHPLIPVAPKKISFVGAWDREREEIMTQLTDFDIHIFGNNWDRVSKKSILFDKIYSKNIYDKDLAKVIFSSSVSLNLLRPQNTGAHNMRTFEIPAMRGLMLTTRSEEQNTFFPEEEACLMFSGLKELRDQLNRIISDPKRAQKIREHAFNLCQKHSYTDRARHLAQIISDRKVSHAR